MTLDEAIKHCYIVAETKCNKCGAEHLQLARWLQELKQLRESAMKEMSEKPTRFYCCRKCVHECYCDHKYYEREGKCPDYKRDAPDGGYYG